MAWTATFAVLTLGGVLVATLQVARFSSSVVYTRAGVSAAESAPQEPGRAALKAQIDRRWPEIKASGEALMKEFRELQAEERALEALRYRIESRRRQYREGLPPDAHADDQLDVLDYNQRMTGWQTRINDYDTRLAEYRKAAAEFDQLMQQYDSGN